MAKDVRVQFGEALRKAREKAGISQEELCERAGVHRTFVSLIERGKRNVTLQTIEKLAKSLGCRMADLMPDAKKE
jgi:transcriptional regulator with XRE-family HTH domain